MDLSTVLLLLFPFITFSQIHIDQDNDVGIGTTATANSKLRVYNGVNSIGLSVANILDTTTYKSAIYTSVTAAGTGFKVGLDNNVFQGDGSTAETRGITNFITPKGTGISRALYNHIYPEGTGQKVGIQNSVSQNSASTQSMYGVNSIVYSSGTGPAYGINNTVTGGGTSSKRGILNTVNQVAGSTAESYGISNLLTPGGSGKAYGLHSVIYGQGTGQKVGLYSTVTQDTGAVGATFGTYSSVNNLSDITTYGYYSTVAEGGIGYKTGIANYVYQNSGSTGSTHTRGQYNVIRNYGDGYTYAVENYIGNEGTSYKAGIFQSIFANPNSTKWTIGIYNRSFLYGQAESYGIYNYTYTDAGSSNSKFGIYNYLQTYGTGNRYALYSRVDSGADYAGYFVGNVHVTGTITEAGSDERLKENVEDLNNALGLVLQMTPKTYTFIKDKVYQLPDGPQYGLMAQDLEKILPSLVREVQQPGVHKIDDAPAPERRRKKLPSQAIISTDTPLLQQDSLGQVVQVPENGNIPEQESLDAAISKGLATGASEESYSYKTVNYKSLIPILVGAIQDQQKQIDAWRNR